MDGEGRVDVGGGVFIEVVGPPSREAEGAPARMDGGIVVSCPEVGERDLSKHSRGENRVAARQTSSPSPSIVERDGALVGAYGMGQLEVGGESTSNRRVGLDGELADGRYLDGVGRTKS